MGARWRLALLAGLCTLATACATGDDGGDGVASISGTNPPSSSAKDNPDDDVDQLRAYAKCMREHGVDMPDPEVDGDGGVSMSIEDGGAGKATIDKADKECKHLMPNGGEPPEVSPEDLDRMREEAQCLRDHGVDAKDPTADKPGIQIEGSGSDDEKTRKAMEECSDGKGSVSSGGGK